MTEFSSFLAFDRRKKKILWGLDLAFSSNRTGPLLQISHYPSCKSSLQNFALYSEGTVLDWNEGKMFRKLEKQPQEIQP